MYALLYFIIAKHTWVFFMSQEITLQCSNAIKRYLVQDCRKGNESSGHGK